MTWIAIIGTGIAAGSFIFELVTEWLYERRKRLMIKAWKEAGPWNG